MAGQITKDQKNLLEPYAEKYWEIFRSLRDTDDDALNELLAACLATSQTNCWAHAYYVAQLLIPEIKCELRSRSPAIADKRAE